MTQDKIDKLFKIFISKLRQREKILSSSVVDLVKLKKIDSDLADFSSLDFLARYKL